MSDIVAWLRETTGLGVSHPHLAGYVDRHGEAADEIERLRQENADLYVEAKELQESLDGSLLTTAALRQRIVKCHELLQSFFSITNPDDEPNLIEAATEELMGDCGCPRPSEYDALRQRIEELEEAYRVVTSTEHFPPGCGRYLIKHEQIRAAWVYLGLCESEEEKDLLLMLLDKFHIHRCGECGGSRKSHPRADGVWVDCPDCHGEGWVIKE